MDGWTPTFFPGRRFPATWTGAPHEWQVTERTARGRHRDGKPLVVGWSREGVGHTVLRFPEDERLVWDLVVEHRHPDSPDLIHRAELVGETLTGLAVSRAGETSPFARSRSLVTYADCRDGHVRAPDGDDRIRTARLRGVRDPRYYSHAALPAAPETTALRAWCPDAALATLCDRLPAMVAEAEAQAWLEHTSDARERGAAVAASVDADARLDALLAARPAPAAARKGWFRRRRDDDGLPWAIGAERLADVLAGTGRRFTRHPDDQTRMVTAAVPDGEVALGVVVEREPNLPLRVTGLLVLLGDRVTLWSDRRAEPTDEDELRALLQIGLDVFDGCVADLARPVGHRFDPAVVERPW